AVVELVLDGSNRRTREPFTVQMIVTVARSLLIGMCLRYRTSPSIVDGSRNSNSALPSRLASALEAVLMHFSEPVPPSAS
ncbi:MAG TPA: hypothetical protein VL068_14320, partial [Microthrixaceae bacterium]|nr:hypothetical protein [Microthrixaceae bacterium]